MLGSMPGEADGCTVEAYLETFFHRTALLLGEERMRVLAGKTVAVAGCGGVGGAAAITLARLGVGGFVLADPGIFDPPDANRQWAATRATMGRNKAEVHADILRAVNPTIRLRVHPEGVRADNLDALLDGADLLIDCLDISVPLDLRGRVYRRAQERGLYAITSPIFGFGTAMLVAAPDGMGMDGIIDDFVRVASETSRLPPGFPAAFFGPHLETIEREIHKHRLPSSGIAVTVATGLVCAEVARILLRDTYPELHPPVVLPKLLAVEPLRGTFRVMHHRELFGPPGGGLSEPARREALRAAHHNVSLLPADAVDCDRLTDSRSAHPHPGTLPPSPLDAATLLQRLTGYPHAVAVRSGRYAESILAPLVVRRGSRVGVVAPFPTTAWHVAQAGGEALDLTDGSDPAFGANVDLDALRRALDAGDVSALWIEPCNNALGGTALSLANLRQAHALARNAGVPLVLDGSRLWTNAALLRRRDPEVAGWPLEDVVRALCDASDAMAASLTKEFLSPVGGVIAARDPRLFAQVRDRTELTVGDGLSPDDREFLASALHAALEGGSLVPAKVAAVEELARALLAAGAPVVQPVGGHAVLLDARAALPHLGPDDHPEQVLAAAIYVTSGVRVGPHLSPGADGRRLVRICVPIGLDPADAQRRLVEGLSRILAEPEAWGGLEALPGADDSLLSTLHRHFRERT